MFHTTAIRALTRAVRLPSGILVCRRVLPTHPTIIPLAITSSFSTSVPAFKKTPKPAKGDHHTSASSSSSSSSSSSDTPASVDTFDPDEHFAALETELAKIIEKLKDDLSKLRTSRVDPNQFEGVTVIMDKVANETVLLKDIAHVVVKGRNLSVGVYEAANVKRVFTALQKAEFNITPVIDPKNPNHILMPLPPPTKESRMATVDAASKVGEKANAVLRNTRQGSHKRIKSFKGMRQDDMRKADKQLEKIMEKAGADAKKVTEGAKKAIMEA